MAYLFEVCCPLLLQACQSNKRVVWGVYPVCLCCVLDTMHFFFWLFSSVLLVVSYTPFCSTTGPCYAWHHCVCTWEMTMLFPRQSKRKPAFHVSSVFSWKQKDIRCGGLFSEDGKEKLWTQAAFFHCFQFNSLIFLFWNVNVNLAQPAPFSCFNSTFKLKDLLLTIIVIFKFFLNPLQISLSVC